MSAEQVADEVDRTQDQAQDQAQGQRPRVAVLMPVFKPQPSFLLAQLSSIRAQRQADVQVYCIVADQVSGEEIGRLASEAGLAVSLIQPDRALKVTAAIALGLEKALEEGGFDYLAFCDQDDVWLADKLNQQVQVLTDTGAGLTYSDALVVDAQDRQEIGSLQALERRPRVPSMMNLALGNIGTGMTFLMTHDFAVTLQAFMDVEDDEMLHDYQAMILGAQLGQVVFDNRAWVRYRQHAHNLVGLSAGDRLRQKIRAIRSGELAKDNILKEQAGAAGSSRKASKVLAFLDILGFWRVWLWVYGKNVRRYFLFGRMERKFTRLGLRSANRGIAVNFAQVFVFFFFHLVFRRFARSFNALILLWLMARYPGRAKARNDGVD